METQLLLQLLSNENEVRKQAEQQIEQARDADQERLIQILIAGMNLER